MYAYGYHVSISASAATLLPATKGDHRPAKDLLLHTKVIEPLSDSSVGGMSCWVGVAVSVDGTRLYRDTRTGRVAPQNQLGGGIVIGTTDCPAGPDPFDGVPGDSQGLPAAGGTRGADLRSQIAALEAQLREIH